MPHFKTIALVLCDGLHSVCGVCSSPNKSTSYLSLCLSLNSFCDETSRTWSLLGPETRSVTSVGKLWGLGGFESQTEVKFQFYLFFCFFFLRKENWDWDVKWFFPKLENLLDTLQRLPFHSALMGRISFLLHLYLGDEKRMREEMAAIFEPHDLAPWPEPSWPWTVHHLMTFRIIKCFLLGNLDTRTSVSICWTREKKI